MSSTNPIVFTDDSNLPVIRGESFRFRDYDRLMEQARAVSGWLASLEVTDAAEAEIKRIVADARKLTTAINDRKKEIKQEIMAPYKNLEDQAKELISVIEAGESIARSKLKDIDAIRREDKRAAIRRIWDLRAPKFAAGEYLTADDFITDRHLNKTMTMNQVETDMVTFLTGKSGDILLLQSTDHFEEYLVEYRRSLNLAEAMSTVNKRHEAEAAVSKPAEHYMVIRITGRADCALAKQLLSDINYRILEEN